MNCSELHSARKVFFEHQFQNGIRDPGTHRSDEWIDLVVGPSKAWASPANWYPLEIVGQLRVSERAPKAACGNSERSAVIQQNAPAPILSESIRKVPLLIIANMNDKRLAIRRTSPV